LEEEEEEEEEEDPYAQPQNVFCALTMSPEWNNISLSLIDGLQASLGQGAES
jgi:hypothetical protein